MIVYPITRKDCLPFILNIHYAKRCPSISYAFGLFDDDELIGICTFGTPSSATLRCGIAGHENAKNVIELNRLCLLYNRKNEASFLVSSSIRMLPKNKIIVSFADTEQKHKGVVYQACNFIYTGLSAKRTDWKVKGMENLHGQTIADEFRGKPCRVTLMKEKYGDDFYLQDRPRKHRYIYLHGNKYFRNSVIKKIKYPIMDYPK